ncbi:MAG: hypothetical protein GY888_32960, partial [Planctomycetaceae bacterium]|nr:hypothetical protein [Planctomycetaceae bacterium]
MFKRPCFWFTLLLLVTTTSVAQAQLFGTRPLGQPLSRRPGASAGNDAGQIAGNERFLRENRRRSDFVGSDQRDQQ